MKDVIINPFWERNDLLSKEKKNEFPSSMDVLC